MRTLYGMMTVMLLAVMMLPTVAAADHVADGGVDETWVQAMDQESYWEDRFGPGAECTKYEGHNGWIPAKYEAAVIKDGTQDGTQVRVYEGIGGDGFQAKGPVNPANGQHFPAPHSWVMKCDIETTTTTTAPSTTTTQPETTTTTPSPTAFVRVTPICVDESEGTYIMRVRHEGGVAPVDYQLRIAGDALTDWTAIGDGEVDFVTLQAGDNGVKAHLRYQGEPIDNEYGGTGSTPRKPCVEAVAPDVVQSTICEVEGVLLIPDTDGVRYLLDGETVAGEVSGPVSGVVTAEAIDGAHLTNPDFEFVVDIPAAEDCPPPTTTPPTTTPPTTTPPPTIPPTTQPESTLDGFVRTICFDDEVFVQVDIEADPAQRWQLETTVDGERVELIEFEAGGIAELRPVDAAEGAFVEASLYRQTDGGDTVLFDRDGFVVDCVDEPTTTAPPTTITIGTPDDPPSDTPTELPHTGIGTVGVAAAALAMLTAGAGLTQSERIGGWFGRLRARLQR